MSSILKALSDLVGSILEVFTSIINTIFSVFQSIFSIFGTLTKDVVNLFGGLINFIFSKLLPDTINTTRFRGLSFPKHPLTARTGNIFIIGTILAAFFLYIVYSQRQAKPVGAKKTA